MEEQEIDYLQPTKFASIQSLGELWAHLEEECDKALVVAIPCVCMASFGATASQKNDIAMELADIQVMCNSIIEKLDGYPTLGRMISTFINRCVEPWPCRLLILLNARRRLLWNIVL